MMTADHWLSNRELYREQTGEIPQHIVQAPAETHIPNSEYVSPRARLVAIVCASILAIELVIGSAIIIAHVVARI